MTDQPTDDSVGTHTVVVPTSIDMVSVLGPGDSHVRHIERTFPVHVDARDNRLTVTGDDYAADLVQRLLEQMVALVRTGQTLSIENVEQITAMLREEAGEDPAAVLSHGILSNRGRNIRPKTLNQKHYVDAIDEHTITFGIGPAGTGKTYLAMAKAVQALQNKQVHRIILTRPAVEAGERLGFLPGSLTEKIDPYLRPLYDALHDMVDPDTIPRLMASGVVEVAPLAYMRGRTLNDAFVILDEAQNTTPEQMKMFLTRLGFNSKMVVTGDTSQIDLPGNARSGLKVIEGILDGVDDISFNHLAASDVVRHKLVGAIVAAYDTHDADQERHRARAAAARAEREAAQQSSTQTSSTQTSSTQTSSTETDPSTQEA